MATIRSKIIANIVILLLTILGIVGLEYRNISVLGDMQDEGTVRARNAVDAKEASMGGMALYQIIADMEINRDLEHGMKEWEAKKAEVSKNMDAVAKVSDTPQEKKILGEAKNATDNVIAIFEKEMLPLLKGGDTFTPEIKAVDQKLDEHVSKIESAMDGLVDSMQKEMEQADRDYDAARRNALIEAVLIGVIGILLQAGLGALLLKGIMGSIAAMGQTLTAVCEGDLTKQVEIKAKDELAEMTRHFNQFVGQLHGMINQITRNSERVVAASGQLTSVAEQIATGAEEVAAQSSAVATAGEEMSTTSGDIAQNCQKASEGAAKAYRSAESGARVVEKTVTVMGEIAERVHESARTVESLGERSDQIGAIIVTIEDIADQTNLLALNAAIEAARAGEQGRGFAVVADEVRALAERTTRATREIDDMIKAIQRETKGAVAAMEQGVEQVQAGTEEAAKSGDALRDILEQVNEVAMQVNQVATAAEEQTATTGEISNSMQQISQIVQETAKGAHQSATAAHDLYGSAEELKQLVLKFKL